MNEPAQPFTYYDIIILILLVIAFYFFTNKRLEPIDRKIIRAIKMILIFIIIPFISVGIEIDLAVGKSGIHDSFTLLYTYLKIPLWWFIGVIIICYGSYINNLE